MSMAGLEVFHGLCCGAGIAAGGVVPTPFSRNHVHDCDVDTAIPLAAFVRVVGVDRNRGNKRRRDAVAGRPKKTLSLDGDISEAALDYQQKVEHDIQAKIKSRLKPLLGPDKFRTTLAVECGMTSGKLPPCAGFMLLISGRIGSADPEIGAIISSMATWWVQSECHANPFIPGVLAWICVEAQTAGVKISTVALRQMMQNVSAISATIDMIQPFWGSSHFYGVKGLLQQLQHELRKSIGLRQRGYGSLRQHL